MLPILYQGPELILYSYPLLMGIGWGIGYQIYFSCLDSNVSKLKGQFLFWGIFLFSWVGAKLLFFLTFKEANADYLSELSFWTGGGFVFYGGFLGALLYLFIWKIFDKGLGLSALWSFLPALAIGHAVGRIGCFLAGCCYGRPTSFFWGVFMHNDYRHPTQLFEALGLFSIGIVLLKWKKPIHLLLAFYLVSYGVLRILIEMLRGDAIRGQWGPLTPSQWISLTLIASGIFVYISRVSFNSSKAVK